jgi:hypothetical protein
MTRAFGRMTRAFGRMTRAFGRMINEHIAKTANNTANFF